MTSGPARLGRSLRKSHYRRCPQGQQQTQTDRRNVLGKFPQTHCTVLYRSGFSSLAGSWSLFSCLSFSSPFKTPSSSTSWHREECIIRTHKHMTVRPLGSPGPTCLEWNHVNSLIMKCVFCIVFFQCFCVVSEAIILSSLLLRGHFSKMSVSENRECNIIPQTVCPHWGVLTKSVKAGAWSGCSHAHAGLRHLTCKLPHKVALVKSWHVFRLHRLAHSVRRGSGPRHFSCKFPYKVALVKSWHAFRWRRLAQRLRCGFWPHLGRGIFPVNFWVKWLFWCLLWNVDMHFDCAGSHRVCVAFWARNVDMHFDCAGSHKVCVRVLGPIWVAAFFL